ncbi:hypothetical protein KY328_01490, partial [Candidatus Woesearchaeota archaeon]|nr:hypothetical protein [Candidatus Woesearchaeota archaeon]
HDIGKFDIIYGSNLVDYVNPLELVGIFSRMLNPEGSVIMYTNSKEKSQGLDCGGFRVTPFKIGRLLDSLNLASFCKGYIARKIG